jgi:hypothetical protein
MTKKKIIFNVYPEFHREVKVRAGIRNMTIKEYVMRALTETLIQERKYLPLKDKE